MAQSTTRGNGSKKNTKKSTATTRKKTTAAAKKKQSGGLSARTTAGVICFLAGTCSVIGIFRQGYWLIDIFSIYVFKGLFGWGFYLAAPVMLYGAALLFFCEDNTLERRLTALFSMPALLGAVVHMIRCGSEYSMSQTRPARYYMTGMTMQSGGLCSSYISEALREALSAYGALPLLILLLLICLIVSLNVPVRSLLASRPRRERKPREPREPRQRREKVTETPALPAPTESSMKKSRAVSSIDIPLDDLPDKDSKKEKHNAIAEQVERYKEAKKRKEEEKYLAGTSDVPAEDVPPMPAGYNAARNAQGRSNAELLMTELSAERRTGKRPASIDVPLDEPAGIRRPAPAGQANPRMERTPRPAARPAAQKSAAAADAPVVEEEPAVVPDTYVYPSLDLLTASDASARVDARGELMANQERLALSLKSFGVGAKIVGFTRGPSITRYELELDAGLRLSKLTNLSKDLALSLGVSSVRIAPIPGRVATVGIEVPNQQVSTVHLRDVLDTPQFKNAKSCLSFAIGKDIAGNSIVGNISRLPHLLIAGTTGSGKSVCMNSLILSLLYKSSPDEVRLIMIDPKMVELGIYNGIPHLYIPVVTDPKKASGALQWSVVEMLKRYRLFSEVGVRDIAGYNEHQKQIEKETIPNLVIVIDELADLMMTAAKEVEESICRVAQMGRAAGVHLVIATQRPSADVITGLMKANIPSRIAFAVSSALESRIIMDNAGAEKLVGQGDMLYSPLGIGEPVRIQGAYVSDEEREQVIDFIKQGGEARYDQTAIADIERKAAEKDKEKDKGAPRSAIADEIVADQSDNPFAGCDELLPQAVDVILETKQASVSMLQRRLKLGYARAARLVDQMEELGIVGPFEGSKPRALLIDRKKWQEMNLSARTPMERLMDEERDDNRGDAV